MFFRLLKCSTPRKNGSIKNWGTQKWFYGIAEKKPNLYFSLSPFVDFGFWLA